MYLYLNIPKIHKKEKINFKSMVVIYQYKINLCNIRFC